MTDPQHTKYLNDKSLHEAGYDSLLTAQVFLRLSAEIHEQAVVKEEKMLSNLASPGECTYNETTPNAEWQLNRILAPQPWTEDIAKHTHSLIDIEEPNNMMSLETLDGTMRKITGPDKFAPNYPSPPPSSSSSSTFPQQRPVDWREPLEVARIRSIFAHPNKFDLLTDQTEETVSNSASSNNIVKYDPIFDPTRPLLDFPEETVMQEKVDRGELIPRFNSDFWEVYGNKLRVYGTAEEVCELTKAKEK